MTEQELAQTLRECKFEPALQELYARYRFYDRTRQIAIKLGDVKPGEQFAGYALRKLRELTREPVDA